MHAITYHYKILVYITFLGMCFTAAFELIHNCSAQVLRCELSVITDYISASRPPPPGEYGMILENTASVSQGTDA